MADQQPSNHPPAETGRRLGTIARGQGSELRICEAEYLGRPYISVRVWECDRHGQWWPAKGKGCSIRLGEIEEVITALLRVRNPEEQSNQQTDQRAEQPSPSPPAQTSADVDDRPQYRPRRERRYRNWYDHMGIPDPRPKYDDPVSGELRGLR